MRKGLSPLVAVVLLVALTMATFGLIASWMTSTTNTELGIIEKSAKKHINCTDAMLEINAVSCSNSSQKLRVSIRNSGEVPLYDFSVFAQIDSSFYENSTGGPNSTNPLKPGQSITLTYFCNKTICSGGATVKSITVSPGICPQAAITKNVNVVCQ